jgi:hypothetical protein
MPHSRPANKSRTEARAMIGTVDPIIKNRIFTDMNKRILTEGNEGNEVMKKHWRKSYIVYRKFAGLRFLRSLLFQTARRSSRDT